MDRWFRYKRDPSYTLLLMLVLMTVTVMGIRSSGARFALQLDGINNTSAAKKISFTNKQWTDDGGYGTITNVVENCNNSSPTPCSDLNAECRRAEVQRKIQTICRCKIGYEEIQKDGFWYCKFILTDKPNKSQEIYKASMVALACFILVILGIFLMFVFNRSIQRSQRSRLNVLQRAGSSNSSGENIFSVCDQLARERLNDKPPTYEDVALKDQQILGMPPPIYSVREEESPLTSAASALRLYPFSNQSSATGQTPFSNAASATRQFPFPNTENDTRRFNPSSNEAIASEQSPSLNAAGVVVPLRSSNNVANATVGHHNEAFVSDA